MLHNAGSIAANDPAHGGSSGIYLADLLKRMGLYDEVKPKLVLCKTGRECALALVRGDAEIGITFTSEFVAVAGTRVVGPLPKEIEYVNGYAGAIPRAPRPNRRAHSWRSLTESGRASALPNYGQAFGLD